MYTYPSATINYVTYTAKRWGQFPTITYVDGSGDTVPVTAGHEVVTVASDLSNITIRIAPSASTNLQIKTAINAADFTTESLYVRDLIDVAITSGHNSDTNVAVTATTLSGASSVPPRSEPSIPSVDIRTVDPVNPAEGQVWYNTTSHLLKFFNGTAVKTVTAS